MFDIGMSVVLLAMISLLFLLVYCGDIFESRFMAMARLGVWVAFIGIVITLLGVWRK